jgi:two-component system OmpR family sensor kinase
MRKWRPPLVVVLGGALGAVLALPILGLFALRALQADLGFRNSVYLVAGVVSLATLILGWLLWRLLFVPIKTLEAQTIAVRRGAAVGELQRYGTKELGSLGLSVLGMARSLQDREATIRHFADHVTHELKTPLTAIKAAAEMLEGADARLLAAIAHSVARMEAELESLRRVAAARDPLYHGQAQLAAVVARLGGFGVEITFEDVELPLSEGGLVLALGHLLRNAVEHGARRVRFVADGGDLLVEDDGAGISEGNRGRIFDPFFTTRREAGGTGMGLAILRGLLSAHGAEIRLDPGAVTRFRIVFAES